MINNCKIMITVNTGVKAALTDKPHPEFGNSNFGKNFWKEIKINHKWSLLE